MTPQTDDPQADQAQRQADVAQLIDNRQEQVHVERERQQKREAGLEAVTKLQQVELTSELKVIEEKRAAAKIWRAEQKEKKRALALERLQQQKLLEHELQVKAQAQAEHEKQAAYMSNVHRIAAQKRFKATEHAAEREEEQLKDDAERREHSANVTTEIQHQIVIQEIEHKGEARRKELERQFHKRRQDLDVWAQRQGTQITGIVGPLSTRDRLTPDQRRRVQMVEQERARNLETITLEERQQMQSLDLALTREREAAKRLYEGKLGSTARARHQSEDLAERERADTIERAAVRANSTAGPKETSAQKEKAIKEQAAKVARRQARTLY